MNEKEILANAPKGWSHVDIDEDEVYFLKASPLCWWLWTNPLVDGEYEHFFGWVDVSQSSIERFCNIRSRTDIERIVELEEIAKEVAELKFAKGYMYTVAEIKSEAILKARGLL